MSQDVSTNYLLLAIRNQMSEFLVWRTGSLCTPGWPFYPDAVQPRREGKEFVGLCA